LAAVELLRYEDDDFALTGERDFLYAGRTLHCNHFRLQNVI
jgi:hypothetical protein